MTAGAQASQVQQLIGGSGGQLQLDAWIHRRVEMGRHARDDDARSAGFDDLTEFVQSQCDTEQVDSQDGFRRALQWRESSSVDDMGEPATRTREIRQLGKGSSRIAIREHEC